MLFGESILGGGDMAFSVSWSAVLVAVLVLYVISLLDILLLIGSTLIADKHRPRYPSCRDNM